MSKKRADVHIIPKALAPLAGQALASIEDLEVIWGERVRERGHP